MRGGPWPFGPMFSPGSGLPQSLPSPFAPALPRRGSICLSLSDGNGSSGMHRQGQSPLEYPARSPSCSLYTASVSRRLAKIDSHGADRSSSWRACSLPRRACILIPEAPVRPIMPFSSRPSPSSAKRPGLHPLRRRLADRSPDPSSAGGPSEPAARHRPAPDHRPGRRRHPPSSFPD